MRKPFESKSFVDVQERKCAEMLNAVMNFDYTEELYCGYFCKRYSRRRCDALYCYPESVCFPSYALFDIVGLLHSSIRFSPYLRLPVLGKNINSELAFVSIKGVNKLTNSGKANRSIRKVMENIGKKMANLASLLLARR